MRLGLFIVYYITRWSPKHEDCSASCSSLIWLVRPQGSVVDFTVRGTCGNRTQDQHLQVFCRLTIVNKVENFDFKCQNLFPNCTVTSVEVLSGFAFTADIIKNVVFTGLLPKISHFPGPAGLAVKPLDLHVVNVGSIPTGPTHGEAWLQPHPGDVLKSTPNVRKSPRSGLNLEGRLSDPQMFENSLII